jgi:hypothetical protein
MDVIIAGAGPVGLMLAVQLQRRGIPHRLLESRSGRDYGGQALELSPRSLEIFDQMGILGEALARGLVLTARSSLADETRLERLELAPYPYNSMAMGQFDIEEILERELWRSGGRIEWSSTVRRIERNFSGVEVEWSTPAMTCQGQCRYLVGCDGADSFVRKNLRGGGLGSQSVERYRERNCFLAGDAAHIHPPGGGLGMNTGLQDAYNLGWKLAAVLRGEALENLLETYQEERQRVGQELMQLAAGPAEERAGTQMFVDYRGSTLAHGMVPQGQSGAAPGHRLDSLSGLCCRFLAAPFRLIEFLRHGEFQLIGFGGDWDGLAAVAEHLGNVFGSQLHCLAIASPDGPQPSEGLLCLHDPQHQVSRVWGPGPGAILVRPDGYVGWRGLPQRDECLDRFLAQVSLNLRP